MIDYLIYFVLDFLIILCAVISVFSWRRLQIFVSSLALSLLLLILAYISNPSSILFYFFSVFIILDLALFSIIGSVELFQKNNPYPQRNKFITVLLATLITASAAWLIYFINFENYTLPELRENEAFMEKFSTFLNSLWGPGFVLLLLLGVLIATVMLGSLLMARIRKANE